MSKELSWWLYKDGFKDEDLEYLNDFCPSDISPTYDMQGWLDLTEQLKKYIPLGNTLNDHILYVHKTASDFINYLFDKYVVNDTLLITSVVEHETVEKNIARLDRDGKDHIRMHFYNGMKTLNLAQVREVLRVKKYKKAFVYIIGTQITTGEITPQRFYEKLRSFLIDNGVEPIMVIDDVHGMYMVPRDYSMFDYVICTAHALIRRWDMGLMWSKTNEECGYHCCDWLLGYINRLDLIMKCKEKLFQFSNVMNEELVEYLPYVEYISNSVPNIYSLKVNVPPRFIYSLEEWKEFANLEVRLETQNYNKDNIFYIRMRASQYITFPELLRPAVEKVKKLIEKVILLKEEGYDRI